jgi:hypothetical protein
MALRDNPNRSASEDDNTIESTLAVARSALERWRWAVRGTPFITDNSDDTQKALRGLVAWYERICVDDTYDSPAPSDGLEALATHQPGPESPLRRRYLICHWAVRVAEELADWHRRVYAGDGDAAAIGLAHAKLDLALRGALDRLC